MTGQQAYVSSRRIAAIGIILLLVAGCHRATPVASDRGPVSGKVTLDDKPLPGGTITFLSPSDARYRATAMIGPHGEFSVADAPLGKVQVTVETLSYSGAKRGNSFPIPPKYAKAETSGLTIEVGPGSREGLAIDLHSR
jgi:hypothetical protein